jgi:hypothetical protein
MKWAVDFEWLCALLSKAAFVGPIAVLAVSDIHSKGWWLAFAVTNLLSICWLFIGLPFVVNRPHRIRWSAALRRAKTVIRFRSSFRNQIVVRYDPSTLDEERVTPIIAMTDACLEELAAWHGFRLRGRVCVVILQRVSAIQAIFGSRSGALAWPAKRTIVVPATGRIEENIRHELSHLFTAKWNSKALPLLNEGMATWWGKHNGGKSATDALAYYFVPWRLRIGDLVERDRFYQEESLYAAYSLAASFTGFLIRGYGKQCYRDFYQRATERDFERCFYECFAMTLAEAETRWRVEIATTQLLRQRLGRALCY